MHADLLGALSNLDRWWKVFEYKGKRMTKSQVHSVLKYGISKGYKTTDQISDKEVDDILKN